VRKKTKKILLWVGIVLTAGVLVCAGLLLGWRKGLPVHLVNHYSLDALKEEALIMDDCAECHSGEDFHSCSTCHDEHGAVEFADLPFLNLISFTGDVPHPGYLEINQITPYRDQPNTHVKLLDLLADQGVEDFESVTLTARDGGFVTITRENITDQALLLPFTDGIRFAAEDLHVSTWVKGITGIIVVGQEQDVIINGVSTSPGRLLLGPTRQVIVDTARVMFASGNDDEMREAETAARVWGAAISDLAPVDGYSAVLVRDGEDEEYRYDPERVRLAVLVPQDDGLTLVFPGESRAGWVRDVVELVWEK